MELERFTRPIKDRINLIKDIGAMVFDIVSTHPLASHGDHFVEDYDTLAEERKEVIETPTLWD